MAMDAVDYDIRGAEMQFVEIEYVGEVKTALFGGE